LETTIVGIIGIIVLLLLIFLRMPVAFALGFVGISGIAVLGGIDNALGVLYSIPYERNASWILICIPLFVLAGQLALYAEVSKDAYDLGNKWVGRLPGGLAIGSIIGCAGFAATSGSSVATAATMAAISIPEMEKHGYNMKLASGAVAAGGLLGIMIPPSIPLILYGFITQQSVGALFMAGILPGIFTAIVFSLGILVLVALKPHLAPKGESFPFLEKVRSLAKAWRFFLIFGVIIGGIYSGISTVTEAAANGAVVAFLLLIIRKGKQGWPDLMDSLKVTARVTAMMFTIMLGAIFFTIFITLARFPQNMTAFLAGLNASPQVLLILILLMYVPLGMFLDVISMMLITLPIAFPIIEQFQINPIWFGILMTKMCEIGLLTPPVGLNVFVIKGFTTLDLSDIFRGASYFIFLETITLIVLFLFPEISLFLPNLMK
jgi:C4-dicarboxylate transporter, DctM subunit